MCVCVHATYVLERVRVRVYVRVYVCVHECGSLCLYTRLDTPLTHAFTFPPPLVCLYQVPSTNASAPLPTPPFIAVFLQRVPGRGCSSRERDTGGMY